MSIEIRIATVLDTSGICVVLRRSISECCEADHKGDSNIVAIWLKNKTTENVALWLQEPGAIPLVALVDGNVVGFALCNNGELALCYVIPELLCRGVGKSLLRAIESQAVAHGVTAIRLDSTQTARNFYLRNGYSATGPAVIWAGMKCQPMHKNLITP